MMMENKTFAYIRVSTKEQNIERQLEALKPYVKKERDIFIDKTSGQNFNREAYQALKWQLRSGDTVFVKSLDRFGRNKEEIKTELEWFKQNGVIIRILDVPTTMMDFGQFGSLQKSIMEMVDNILIEVLGTFAEQERKMIKERQEEGIKNAKRKGVKFGRPTKEFPQDWANYYSRWKTGGATAVQTMVDLNIPKATFYRMVKEWETKGHFCNP